MKWHRYGNATNAEENNSQNQCGILFPVQEEVSATETDLITRIKTTGKEKNYELIEYLNDVNREHAEVLVEQNINGKTDTSYIYGAEINGGFDRISLDRFDGSTGYYLYDARGSVSGITNEEGQVYQSYRYSVTGEITFGAPQYENEYTYNGESYNPNIESQYLRARYYCVVTATFLTEDSYLGSQTEPLTLNRYNYCVSSYLNYTDPSGNEVEVLESLKGWIIDPDTQAQKTIENYENQRLSLEDAIESGLLNNRAGQIFLDYGDVIMGPPVTLPSSLVGIREAIKGNFDSKEMQRTATAGFYAGFVGQGIEYTQIISNADYQLSMIITSAKGVNSINNPLSYLLFIKDFSLTQTIDAAKAGLQDVWNGTYDSAIGRKIGAGTFNYLLMTIGGAQLKGKGTACEAVESGRNTATTINYSYKFDRELANFNDGYEIRTTVDKDLILVQYSSDAPDASLCYWTTVDEANRITTLNDYMDKLALSKDWGNRNTVKVARIPAGIEVKYAVGTAREQLLIADPRPGGGVQYLFNQFDTDWITEIRSFSN